MTKAQLKKRMTAIRKRAYAASQDFNRMYVLLMEKENEGPDAGKIDWRKVGSALDSMDVEINKMDDAIDRIDEYGWRVIDGLYPRMKRRR